MYAPNSHQIRFLKRIFHRIAKIRKGSLVMCGDYNLTADYSMDITSKSKKPLPKLQPLLHSENVYDVWRCQHASEQDFTPHLSRHIILFLTSPTTSLPHAHSVLNEFSQISFYKVNFMKSLILDLGVPPHLRIQLQADFPYTWSKSNIS